MLYFQIYNKQAATTWNVVKKKMDTKLLLWPQKISYLNRYKLFLYNIVVEYKDAMTHSMNIQWLSTVKIKFYILYRSWKIFLDHLKLGYEVHLIVECFGPMGKIVVSFEVLSAFSTFDVLYFFCMTKTTLQYNNVGGQTDQQKCVLIEWTLQRARTPKI